MNSPGVVLLGDPVSHSLSPRFQGEAMARLVPPRRYTGRRVDADGVHLAASEIRAGLLHGANVTAPHKSVAAQVADRHSERVARLGVANTLWRHPTGTVAAANTDAGGVEASLRGLGVTKASGARVLILGAGGAAAAVVEACGELACAVHVVCRDPESGGSRLRGLLDRVGGRVTGWSPNWSEWTPPEEVEVIVDATSLRHVTPETASAAYGVLGLSRLPNRVAWLDLGYGATLSPFLELGTDRGARTLDGLSMLLHQGAAAFMLWFEQAPPLKIMARALCDATGRSTDRLPLYPDVVDRAAEEERGVECR